MVNYRLNGLAASEVLHLQCGLLFLKGGTQINTGRCSPMRRPTCCASLRCLCCHFTSRRSITNTSASGRDSGALTVIGRYHEAFRLRSFCRWGVRGRRICPAPSRGRVLAARRGVDNNDVLGVWILEMVCRLAAAFSAQASKHMSLFCREWWLHRTRHCLLGKVHVGICDNAGRTCHSGRHGFSE